MAVVLSVTHKGQPIQDALKLQRLQQMLFDMMDQKHQGIVTIKTVSSPSVCCHAAPLHPHAGSLHVSTKLCILLTIPVGMDQYQLS